MTKTKNLTVYSFQPDGYMGVHKVGRMDPDFYSEFSTKTMAFEVRNNRYRVICQLWLNKGD